MQSYVKKFKRILCFAIWRSVNPRRAISNDISLETFYFSVPASYHLRSLEKDHQSYGTLNTDVYAL